MRRSAMQSDQIVGSSCFAEQYFDSVGQAMDFNGPSGFSKYNSATQHRLQFYDPSAAADFSPSSKRSADKNFKGKKRKGAPETPQDRIRVKMESLNNTVDADASKEDYIHVRAKRGHATNSHSLAERVRREKISERMRLLQDLVPGCSKITGKAMMLDEIINYVQSLQRQVEFLSMKLAAVNPEMSFDLEQILTKDVRDRNAQILNQIQSNFHGSSPNGIAQPEMLFSIQNPGIPQFPAISQVPGTWDDELQNIIQMGFVPNAAIGGPENSSTNLNFGFESYSRELTSGFV